MTISVGGPLLLVGAGNMGSALLAGWMERGLDPATVYVQDPDPAPSAVALMVRHDIASGMPPALPGPASVIVLALKPDKLESVVPDLSGLAGPDTVFLSVAAGKTLASLGAMLGVNRAIVRAMPNTPAAIGRGMSVACANEAVSPDQAERCITLLSAVGEVAWIDDERLMDAVTAVSGSGPAYVFYLAECLAKAGQAAGLDEALAQKLATVTVAGAGELIRQSGEAPAELRRKVTSPGGTTEAALTVLMGEDGLQSLMERAVLAAAERSRQLSS